MADRLVYPRARAMKRMEDMTEPELGALMTEMARAVEFVGQRRGIGKPHFCLLLFNDPEIAQYIGNCDRSDMIKAMRECADRLESRQDLRR